MPVANNNARKLTYSAFLLALLMILLYLSTILPTNKFTIYMFASFITGIILIETNYKYTIIFYFASILLSLIFPISKLSLLLYYSFFGIYGLIKYFIEKANHKLLEYIFKTIFIILIFTINFLFSKLFLPDIIDKLPLIVVIPVVVIVFLIYDYLYSLIMDFYYNRIYKMRSKNVK